METLDDTISKVVFDVARGSTRPADAAASLRKLAASSELSSSILDYVWLGGFDESSESRSRLQQLMSVLMQDEFVSVCDAICSLEPELIPSEIQTDQVLRRKRMQTKTKKVYNIVKFNTLSECPEGYAVLVDLLWCASKFNSTTFAQCKKTMGQFSLCPNRSLSMAISVLCYSLESDLSPDPLLDLIGSIFPPNRIQSVLLFHLLSMGKEGSMVGPSDRSLSAAVPEGFVSESHPMFMRAITLLAKRGLVDPKALWPILTPSTESIASSVDTLLFEYEKQIENVSKILGGAISNSEESVDVNLTNRVSEFSDLMEKSQKVQFISEIFQSGQNDEIAFLRLLQVKFGSVPIAVIPSISKGIAGWLDALLRQNGPEELIEELLNFMSVYLGSHPSVFAGLCDHPASVKWVGRYILPIQSVMSPSPFFNAKIWLLLATLSPAERYRHYQIWQGQYTSLFPLRLVAPLVQSEVRHLLKRVVKGAQIGDTVSRNSHYQFAKLAASHSVIVLGYVLGQIRAHFNHNLIEPFVDVTGKISVLGQDVFGFLMCVELGKSGQQSLNTKTAMVQPWLANLSEFSGKFLKKHSGLGCLEGLLVLIRSLLSRPGSSTVAQVLLKAIIEHLGNVEVVEDLNVAQLESIAGGPVLNTISQQSTSSSERSSIVERGRSVLKSGLVGMDGLVAEILARLASEQISLRTSQKIAQELMVGGGVKLLGLLNDSVHKSWLQLTEFLSQVCSITEYASLHIADGTSAMNLHVTRPGKNISSAKSIEEIFSALSLFDIYVPETSYQKQISSLSEQIGAQEMLAEKMEKSGPIKKEVLRLKELLTKLELEFKDQSDRHALVLSQIREEKNLYFTNFSNMNVLTNMMKSRLLISVQDALFCVQFIKLLVREKVVGFNCIDFWNQWTIVLPEILFCASEGETRLFAYFVAELFAWIKELRDPKKFAHTVKDNHVWSGVSLDEFIALHAIWETNVLKCVSIGLGHDWAEKRNCLILISKTCHVFPCIHANAIELKSATESLAADSSQEDIAMLALSVSRRIGSMEPDWLDKPTIVAPETTAAPMEVEPVEAPAAKTEPVKRSNRLDSKLEPSPRINTGKRAGPNTDDKDSKRFRDDRSERDRQIRDREPARGRDGPSSRRR